MYLCRCRPSLFISIILYITHVTIELRRKPYIQKRTTYQGILSCFKECYESTMNTCKQKTTAYYMHLFLCLFFGALKILLMLLTLIILTFMDLAQNQFRSSGG